MGIFKNITSGITKGFDKVTGVLDPVIDPVKTGIGLALQVPGVAPIMQDTVGSIFANLDQGVGKQVFDGISIGSAVFSAADLATGKGISKLYPWTSAIPWISGTLEAGRELGKLEQAGRDIEALTSGETTAEQDIDALFGGGTAAPRQATPAIFL